MQLTYLYIYCVNKIYFVQLFILTYHYINIRRRSCGDIKYSVTGTLLCKADTFSGTVIFTELFYVFCMALRIFFKYKRQFARV